MARVAILKLSVGWQRSMTLVRDAGNPYLGVARADQGLRVPTYMVWGAGTDVGKTLVSCGICHIASLKNVRYSSSPVRPFMPPSSHAAVSCKSVYNALRQMGPSGRSRLSKGDARWM